MMGVEHGSSGVPARMVDGRLVMKRCNYTVTFLTPAFLGDAFQNGQWRTPPVLSEHCM
jgi:hypothetical protein